MSTPLHKKILLINGPNLNQLGKREPEIYGTVTLNDLEGRLRQLAATHAIMLETFQSNSEGLLVDAIQQAKVNKIQCIIINPGAYTHTSIALRDAFLSTAIPFIEVHISNIYARESFRHVSYLSDISMGVIIGHGLIGYELAMYRAHHLIQEEQTDHQLNLHKI